MKKNNKIKSNPNSCGALNIPEVDNTILKCGKSILSSECVIVDKVIGDFVYGTQEEFNEYLFKYFLSKLNKIKEEVVLLNPDNIGQSSFLMNNGEVILREQLVSMLKNTSSIITNIENSSIGDSTLFKDSMEVYLDYDKNKFEDFKNNSKNITFIGTGDNNAPIGNFTFKKRNSSELIYGENITINGENNEVTFTAPHSGPILFNITYNGDKNISVTQLTGF